MSTPGANGDLLERAVTFLEGTRARPQDDPDAPPRELELIELSTLLEMHLDKPRELIGQLVREASLGMIHAPAGVGKTFFGLGMAVSLTHGVPFLDYPVNEAFSAVYIDGEMAAYDIRERFRLLSIPLDRKGASLYIVTPDLTHRGIPKVDSEEGRAALLTQLDERPEVKLVVLDNLACLTRPDGDDHGAKSFSFVQDLMLECRRRQVACWIVHHSGKSGEQRGTSRRNDVLDVVLKLTPHMSTEGGRTEVQVTFEKARHMSSAAKTDFSASLEPGQGDGLVWCRSGTQLPVNQRIRLMLLDGMPPADVASELKTPRSYVYRVKEQLVKAGDLAKPRKTFEGTRNRVVPLSPPLNGGTGDRGQSEGTSRGQRGQRFEY
jgi:hypothetical protein